MCKYFLLFFVFIQASLASGSCINLEAAKSVARSYEFPDMDNGFYKHMKEIYVQQGKFFTANNFPDNFYHAQSRLEFQVALNSELGKIFVKSEQDGFYYFISRQAKLGCKVATQLYILCDGSAAHTSNTYSCM